MTSVTSGNTAILFLDLQDNLVAGVKTIGRSRLRRTAGALARLAALHELPTFLSSVEPGGRYLRHVTDALDEPRIRPRTFTSAFDDAALVADLEACGCKLLVLAGVASEIVVVRTALAAIDAGYDVQIAIDACGGFSERTEAAAWNRATAHGAVMTSVVTCASELVGDFGTELGARTLAIVHEATGQ